MGSETLKSKYSSLFDLESCKRCIVADRFYEGVFVGHWSSCPLQQGMDENINNLHSDLANACMVNGDDKWSCQLDATKKYNVSALRRAIDQRVDPNPPLVQRTTIKSKLFSLEGNTNKNSITADP